MDTRTGQLYPDRAAAVAAGVPEEHIRVVDVVTIPNGPFKGRKYQKLSSGKLGRRVFDDAARRTP